MPPFVEFLTRLLHEGTVAVAERPRLAIAERTALAQWLRREYELHALSVAGTPPPFDGGTALAAAECVAAASWFLVSRDEPPDDVAAALELPVPAANAHLSADLLFRFLPQIHVRARAVRPDDVLTHSLATLLRRYPLSGVLADIAEEPLAPLDFDGHAGLQLLYAERLAAHVKPAWVPVSGAAREHVELVFAERGLRLPG
jgi:MoxR-vWA-beta-propeller ternary system domain bpX4